MMAAKPPAAKPAAPPALRLDHYLPYLINRAGVSMATRFGAALRREGVTLQDWRVLAALRERDGQRLTELAGRTSIEISTLSRLVAGLEASGMVIRERDAGDARAIAIRLSDAGDDLTARLTPAAETLERTALSGFSDTEARQLKELLHKLYDNLAAIPALETDAADEPTAGGSTASNLRRK